MGMSVQDHGANERAKSHLVFEGHRDDRPPAADRLFVIIGLALSSWLAIGAFLYAVAPLIIHP